MIQRIEIKNFAIIEDVGIDFHDGLNIVTGETGAGKSIVIQAVSLALGSRADTAFVRTGSDKALVQMVADYDGDEYIITRQVSSSGRNLCKINGEIVTLSQLSALCRKLADIHGQYDHQSLLDPEEHIKLLDRYGSRDIAPIKEKTARSYEEYSRVKKQLKDLETRLAEDLRQQDFIAFEYNELKEAQLRSGEDGELEEQIALLQNSEQIFEDLSMAYSLSEESDYAVLPSMKKIMDHLASAGKWSEGLSALSERMNDIYYEFEDVCSDIRENRDGAVFSPEELDRAIGRLNLLSRLKQKHGKTIDELIDYRDDLLLRMDNVSDSDQLKEELKKKLADLSAKLERDCRELTDVRRKTAEVLEEKISKELDELNFNNSNFSVSFTEAPDYSPEGKDNVEFLISTNRGEALKPLARIASGGEMSRIMLAFKSIIGDYDSIPTMIFDEIDSGISGVAASVVGKKLKDISGNHQIICITHLPQIASQGKHHYRISKDSDDTMTYTHVDELTPEDRVTEIARLLGGSNVTEATIQTAKDLLGS